MPDLNLDLNYFEHPKTSRLIGLLGRGAEVLPIRLWAYCGKVHAKDGRLTRYSPQEIETVVQWWGKSGEFIKAMLAVKFLERDGRGYRVHDWSEHQGHLWAYHVRAKKGAAARWGAIAGEPVSHANGNASSMLEAVVKQCPIHTNQPTSQPASLSVEERTRKNLKTRRGIT